MMMKIPFVLLTLLFLFQPNGAELFSALVDLTKIYSAQKQMIESLQEYIQQEEIKLNFLKKWQNQLKANDKLLTENDAERKEDIFSNPMETFYLIKRQLVNVDQLQQSDEWQSSEKMQIAFQTTLNALRKDLPSEEDLFGVIDAILRLQEVYNFSPRDFVTRKSLLTTSSDPLQPSEIFEIGRRAYSVGAWTHSRKWMEYALDEIFRLEKQFNLTNDKELTEQVLDYLSFLYHRVGSYNSALAITNQWLRMDPQNTRAFNNHRYFQAKATEERFNRNKARGEQLEITHAFVTITRPELKHPRMEEYVNYKQLCQDTLQAAELPRDKTLICRHHKPHAYFYLAPVKEEIVSWSPYIVLWHDIIHNNEIQHIKQLATPQLRRATVMNSFTGLLETAPYRISKSAWLEDNSTVLIQQINNRIAAMTGLSLEKAEPLQVVNYGVGGQYDPHFDFTRKSDTDPFGEDRGNRIATLLYYLTDVEQGGSTVFTSLDIKVLPQKGSAAFWWNLYDSGEGDTRTRHAACPVIKGSKWVMNKWFHERGQEFIRPCTTQTVYVG